MTTPVNGSVGYGYLSPVNSTLYAERNTAAAYLRLVAAHPAAHINGPAGAYWNRATDVLIHSSVAAAAKFGISANEFHNLAAVGHSLHGLGLRLNIGGVSASIIEQFGFRVFNPFTFDYTGEPCWNQPAPIAPAPVVAAPVVTTPVATPTTPVVTTPATPVEAPSTSPAAPVVTTPPAKETPAVSAKTLADQLAARKAASDALQADNARIAAALAATGDDNPLAGLFVGHTIGRKRAYASYAAAALIVSFGPDLATYGIVTGSHVPVLVAWIGLSTSALLKLGAAFGFVAASNTK